MTLDNSIGCKSVNPPTWALPVLAVLILTNPFLLYRKKLVLLLAMCQMSIVIYAYFNVLQALVILGIFYTITHLLGFIK